MKKKSTYILALCIGVAFICYGIYQVIQDSKNPRTDDLKNIHVEIIDEVKDEVLMEETFQTNSEDLGAFLKSEPKVKLVYEDGQYGLYITSLMERDATSSAFWIYESTNNLSCSQGQGGFCPAAEDVILQDGDSFVFKLSDDFN